MPLTGKQAVPYEVFKVLVFGVWEDFIEQNMMHFDLQNLYSFFRRAG